MTQPLKFPAFNTKSGFGIYILFIFCFVSFSGIMLLIFATQWWAPFVAVPMILAGPVVIYFIVSVKIIIGTEFVERKSIFGVKKIPVGNVKSYGVYFQTGKVATEVNPATLKGDDFMSPRMVYISESKDFDLNDPQPKLNIRFQYREENYRQVKAALKHG